MSSVTSPVHSSGVIEPLQEQEGNEQNTPRKKATFQLSQTKNKDSQVETIARGLIDGASVYDVDGAYLNDVTLWLRTYKTSILKQDNPDYETAKRIDTITADLKLANGATQYSEYQKEKIQNITKKLEDAKKNLEAVQERQKSAWQACEEEKQNTLKKLESTQAAELEDLDNEYQDDDLPPRFKKYSPDVIQMRFQEKHLRDAGLYDEAKRMREEREAVEKYELEMRKNDRGREWNIRRDKLIEKHKQQREVAEYKLALKWNQIAPEYTKRIEYWNKVIYNLEARLKTEKSMKREAERETTATLSRCKQRGLPTLQTYPQLSSRSAAMSRVITVSQTRTYTRPKTMQQPKRYNQTSRM